MTLRVAGMSKIEKIGLIFAVLFVALAFVSVGIASAATIYVPDNYSTIQEAVDAANAGDTIVVRDGNYTENVKVNKRLTIRSGNSSDKTIVQAATSEDPVFNVTADYVNISGFTVKGADTGIYLYNADYCNISNNNCSSNRAGVYSNYSKITYTYNGKRWTNYLGNYWSDYMGSDVNSDGTGDTAYNINSDRDNYPLMKPFENYIYAAEESSEEIPTEFQKGMSYAAWWHDTYGSADSDTSLENLKTTGTEWVSLVVTWYQDNASSTKIYRDENRTPTDGSLIKTINKIHSLNMSVMLKPTVDLQDKNENWRGNITFDNITYSDALGLGWQDWSWNCTPDFTSTTSVYRGKYAINVSFEPWGGLSFANPEGVNADRYDRLEFYINGGERGGQQLRLSLIDSKDNELPSKDGISINDPEYIPNGTISPKTWKLVRVPLRDLNATNTKIIKKINIMDNTGHAQPTLYIDDVMLTAPQSKWNEWFSSYEQFILHYADLAEKNNCTQFCVGVEYKGTVHRENNWRDVIKNVSENYIRPITYASNWDNYQNINWWDALDFVGIDAYFPLTNKTDPTVDELKEGWKKWEKEIESWQQRVNKSIIFTEIGYCSVDGTNIEPCKCTSDILDLQEQTDCYNATFQTFWDKPWLAGIYWWIWDTNPNVYGPLDKSYTPYKKPAEDVLKTYYCAKSRLKYRIWNISRHLQYG